MNWQTWFQQIFSLVPAVVQGIEQIHQDAKSGTDKKTLAMEALGLGKGVATEVLGAEKPIIDAAVNAVSAAIDNIVSVMNAFRDHDGAKAALPQTPTADQVHATIQKG